MLTIDKRVIDAVYKKYITDAEHTWQSKQQLDILQEECAELIQAVSKLKRKTIEAGKTPGMQFPVPDNVAEEMAHVLISLNIVARFVGIRQEDIDEEARKFMEKHGMELKDSEDEEETDADSPYKESVHHAFSTLELAFCWPDGDKFDGNDYRCKNDRYCPMVMNNEHCLLHVLRNKVVKENLDIMETFDSVNYSRFLNKANLPKEYLDLIASVHRKREKIINET